MVPIPSKNRPNAKARESVDDAGMVSDTREKSKEQPKKLLTAQPFMLFLFTALASVIGSLTLGWIFAGGAKSIPLMDRDKRNVI